MLIREMRQSDKDIIRSIAATVWRDTYSSFIPEEIQDKVLEDAYSDREMENRFKSCVCLVAVSHNEIMGYAFFSGGLSDKDIFLESLYIHSNHQGKGVGKQLLTAGLKKFNEPTTLSLTVYKGNSNILFYEKQGFKVIKENSGDFYGHPMGFITMKKAID